MSREADFESLSVVQDEILQFTWGQVGDRVDKFYVQGKVTDDEDGNITSVEGNLKYMVSGRKILTPGDVVSDEQFRENAAFVRPRIRVLHDVLFGLQGRSPVRFRWCVDTRSGEVEADWTYYEDLSEREKKDDWWEYWNADFAWKDQLQADLNGEKPPVRFGFLRRFRRGNA